MGTVTNGKKWAGACVNGKVVSGLAKNGVVFYRKPVSTYKRRIMVGDNLKGLTIYNDMKSGYYSVLNEYYPDNYGNENFIVPSTMAIPFSDAKSPTSNGYTYNVQGNLINFYDYYNGTENITPFATNSNSDYIVSTVVDTNPSYKHLFIEDENIRPVQVGDVITSNTKFYFTFPDDFKSFITSPILSSKLIIQLDNSNTGFRVADSYLDSSAVMATIATKFGYTPIRPFIYEYENDTNTLLQNGSYRINIRSNSNESFSGTVTYIDKTDSAYQHILVDATTLGA